MFISTIDHKAFHGKPCLRNRAWHGPLRVMLGLVVLLFFHMGSFAGRGPAVPNTHLPAGYFDCPVNPGMIGSDQQICSGTAPAPITSIASATEPGTITGTIYYNWEYTHDGGVIWNQIPGQHGSGYAPTILNAETWYRRQAIIVDGSLNPLCPGAYSNIVKVTMFPNSLGGVVTADQQICGGMVPADLTVAGNTSAVVKWQSSEDIGFLNPTDINVASPVLPGSAIGPLNRTTWFRAVVDNGSCPAVYSGIRIASLNEDFSSWIMPPANTTFGPQSNGGSMVNSNGQLILDGYGGNTFVQYIKGSELEFSAIFDGTTNFSNIGMSGTSDFDAPFVAVGRGLSNPAGHVFARVNTGSGPIDMDLGALGGQLHTYRIVWGANSFAFYVDGVYMLTIPGSINGPLYQNFYDYPADGRKLIIDNIKVTTTQNTRILVDTPSTGGTLSASQVLCSGSTPANITLTGQVGQVVKWQRADDAAFTTPVDIAVTDNFLTAAGMGAISGSAWFRAVVQKNSCPPAFSSTVRIDVYAPSSGGTASADQSICVGSTPADIVLSGSTGNVLTWQSSTDNAFTAPTDIAVTTTTLSGATVGPVTSDLWLRAQVQNGVCASTYSSPVHISVSPATVGGTASANQAFCAGTAAADILLSGHTGNVVRWESSADAAFTSPMPLANTTSTLSSAEIGILSTDTWFRAVVQSGDCPQAYSSIVHIAVTPVHGGMVTPDGNVCPGANTGSVNLSGHSGTIQYWQSSIDGGISWADIASTSPTYSFTNLAQSTQFRAMVQNGSCPLVASAPATILMNPLPLLVTTDQSAIGMPQTADLTAGIVTAGSDPGLSFTYWNDAAAANALATPAAATPGDYYIKGTNATGCSVIKPVKVLATPLPILTIVDPAPVCDPATIDITAPAVTQGSTPGLSYSYWQDASATIAYASPTQASTGTYYIMGTDAFGYQVIKPVHVVVNFPSGSTTTVSVCDKNLPYVWNGNNYSTSGSYVVKLVNAVGCDSVATLDLIVKTSTTSTTRINIADTQLPYTWNGNTYAAGGSYAVTLTNAAGCDSVANLVLTVVPPATSTTTVAVCGNAFPYTWNSNSYAAPGTYTVKLAASDGRDSIATLILSTVASPMLSVTEPAPVCEGMSAGIILKLQGVAPFTVTYDDGSGVLTESGINGPIYTLNVTPSSTSTYRFLTVEDAHCRNNAVTALATVRVMPAEAGQRLPTVNALANVSRRVLARNLGGEYTYEWSPGDGLSSTSQVDPLFNSPVQQEYRIFMRKNSGCGTTDTLLVKVTDMNTPGHEPDILVPNAFTPNGDGRNDLLSPVPVNLDHLVYFRVFNRWGNLVYECTTAGKGWDGTFKNMPVPTESFSWIAEGVDRNGQRVRRKGMVTLIR